MDRKKNLSDNDNKIYEILTEDNKLEKKLLDLLELRKERLIERNKALGGICDNLVLSFISLIILLYFVTTKWGIIISIIFMIVMFYFLFKSRKYKDPFFENNFQLKAIEELLIKIYKEILKKN